MACDITSDLDILCHFTGDTTDSSGNGNDLTNVGGGATLTTDKNSVSNQAYSYDGSNDYMAVTTSMYANGWTITAWAYLNSYGSTELYIIGGTFNTGLERHRLSVTPSGVLDGAIGDGVVQSSNTFTTGTWHFVAFGFDGTNGFVYLDGTKTSASRSTTGSTLISTTINLGQYQGGTNIRFWNGKIDEFRLYNRALNDEELSALYSGYDNPSCGAGPVATDNAIEFGHNF